MTIDHDEAVPVVARPRRDLADLRARGGRHLGRALTELDFCKQADMTVLMPLDFLKLVWATAFGIVLFAEVPDLFTFLGAAIVFASSFYIAWREAKLRKAKALPPP